MTVRGGVLDAIEHAGVGVFVSEDTTVRGMTGNLHRGDYAGQCSGVRCTPG
jgi:hypothetical protein